MLLKLGAHLRVHCHLLVTVGKGNRGNALFSMSLGTPRVKPRATIASKIIGFLTRLIGETVEVSIIHESKPLGLEKQKLTLGAFLIESSATDHLGFDHDIALCLSRNINDILLCAAIVPRVASESLPNPEDGSIGGHVDTIGSKDPFAGANIKKV